MQRLWRKFRFLWALGTVLVVSSCQKAPEGGGNSSRELRPAEEKLSPFSSESPPTSSHPTSQGQEIAPTDPVDPVAKILSADLSPGETSSRLLGLLATTRADERPFLIQLAGNYCPDEEYWRLLPFILDRNQPEDCREELLRDVLRRPDPVRLRPLYRLALDPTHPLSAEAKNYLFTYLQDVPENDPNALARALEKAEREGR